MGLPRWSVAIGCAALALSGCDAKPKPTTRPADRDFIQAETHVRSGDACAGLPEKNAIAAAIKAAMTDTYGADEAQAQFVVASVHPQDNCRRLEIIYHMRGPGQSPQNASALIGNGGQWYLDFFRKRYPIH